MNKKFTSTSKSCLQRYILPSLIGRGWGVGLFPSLIGKGWGVGLFPSLTGKGWGVGLCLACLLFVACSNDDETPDSVEQSNYTATTVTEAPTWQVDWTYDQERPEWQEPVGSRYENFSVLLVKIEPALRPYASDEDLMALFVGNELRGMSSPAFGVNRDDTDASSFLLKAYGNEANNELINVTLKYYNSRLKQVFSRSASIRYNMDEVFGISEEFIPHFTLGSTKYPVVMSLALDVTPIAKAGIVPAAGDRVAAFVGDECRGTWVMDHGQLDAVLTVFGRKEGEHVTLKYYDTTRSRVLTFADVAVTQQGTITLTE